MSSHGRHHAGLARSGNKADPTTGPTTDRRSARSRMIAIVTHGGSGDAGASGGDAGLYLAHFATGSGSRAFPKTTAPAPPYHKFPRDLGFMGTLLAGARPRRVLEGIGQRTGFRWGVQIGLADRDVVMRADAAGVLDGAYGRRQSRAPAAVGDRTKLIEQVDGVRLATLRP
jgi:hypothetical protein